MKTSLKIILPLAILGGVAVAFQNCSKAGFGVDQDNYNSLNTKYGGPAICNPLGGGTGVSAGAKQGLVGNLIYVTKANQEKLGTPSNLDQLHARGTTAAATLFMSQIDVPARSFTEGFSAAGQPALVDESSGDKLVEWFGIDMRSTIKLAAGDLAGYYQFATISDDGSMLYNDNVVIVANDGTHSPRAKCAAAATRFDGSTALPINFQYFQGPRTTIAAQIAWRKVANANPGPDCPADLLANGWTVVPAKNFFLPADAPANPCP